jgi:hypothetical protein
MSEVAKFHHCIQVRFLICILLLALQFRQSMRKTCEWLLLFSFYFYSISQLLGVTLDWWTRNDTRYGFQWGNASIFTIDFKNANLIAAGRALAPGLLRLGMDGLVE